MTNKIEELKKLKAALETGNYNKTKGTLKGTLPDGSVGYCCLGVYATISGYNLETAKGFHKDGKDEWVYYDDGNDIIYKMSSNVFGDVYTECLTDVNDSNETWQPVIDTIEWMINREGE